MATTAFRIYLQLFLFSLPTLLVCLGACIAIISQWKKGSSWQLWAMLGFGLGLLMTIIMPITQAFVQSWFMHSQPIGSRSWALGILSGIWSIIHACVYILLFVAAFEGRK